MKYLQQGQNLSEYSIILGVVGVVSISGLILIGGNIQDVIKDFFNPSKSQTPLMAAANSSQSLQNGAMLAMTPNTTASSSTSTDFSDPHVLNLQQYPNSIEDQIDVSGANGTTSQLLAVLDATIAQASANDQVNPEQTNLLANLAEQGHRMGKIESIVEDMIQNNPSALKKPYTFEGKTYPSAKAMANELGIGVHGEHNPESQKMDTLLKQAIAQGALTDPTINTVVTTLSNQIMSIANGLSDATDGVSTGEITGKDYKETLVYQMNREWVGEKKSLLDSGAAVVTHNSATAICLTGNSGKGKCNEIKN